MNLIDVDINKLILYFKRTAIADILCIKGDKK